MIFFELIGKIQWPLIGLAVLTGLWYNYTIFREHNSNKGKDSSEDYNKKVMTLWLTCAIFAIAVLIMGTLIPELAQRGAREVDDTLSMVSNGEPAVGSAAAHLLGPVEGGS